MTLTAWPINEHASDAQVIRQQIGSLIGAAGGLVAAGGLELTQKGTPNMSVQIKGGTPAEGGLWIPGYTTTTGPTYFQNSATYEQVIEAAGATNPRVDTIVARIYDTSLDSSGKHEPVFQALRGAEESGVTLSNKKGAAAVPKNCYVLGYVLVPAKASSIVTADIENVAKKVGLASELVTDGAVVSGRLLAQTPEINNNEQARKGEETHTPLGAKIGTIVTLRASIKAGSYIFIKVNGENNMKNIGAIAVEMPITFFVPAGKDWEWGPISAVEGEPLSTYAQF